MIVDYSLAQLPILSEIEAVHASNISAGNAGDHDSWEQTVSCAVHKRQFVAQSRTGIKVRTAPENFAQ